MAGRRRGTQTRGRGVDLSSFFVLSSFCFFPLFDRVSSFSFGVFEFIYSFSLSFSVVASASSAEVSIIEVWQMRVAFCALRFVL